VTDVVWAAGFVDGEGCINLQEREKDSGVVYPIFKLTNTYHKAVHRLKDIVKVGTVFLVIPSNPKAKDISVLVACGDSVIVVCQLLLPYLFVKKRQAEIILEFAKLPILFDGRRLSDETRIRRLILFDEIKELNKPGR